MNKSIWQCIVSVFLISLVLLLACSPVIQTVTETPDTLTITNTKVTTRTETISLPVETSSVTQTTTITLTPSGTTITLTQSGTTVTSTLPGITTTQTITSTVTTTATTTTVFSFTGIGMRNTPTFSINTSPWVLRFTTNWSGYFAVSIEPFADNLVINHAGVAGEVYETYIYDFQGNNLYFDVQSAPLEGLWTLTVIKLS